MRVTLVSTNIVWEDKAANFSLLEKLFASFSFSTDLVILPEFFTTGFTMTPHVAEGDDSPTLKWMQDIASKYNFALMGSIPHFINENESDRRTNRAYFVYPDRSFKFYDKRHLFRMGEENEHYTGGKVRCVVEYKGIRFLLNICYDIRFPVWSRNLGNDYDVLINIANFPDVRVAAIDPLLKARAIENQAYAFFVNRIGADKTCTYIASSMAVDFKGIPVGKEITTPEQDAIMPGVQIIQAEIDLEKLHDFRTKFPAWLDRDAFTIETDSKLNYTYSER